MGISGRLDDVSIAEVMQFIHLGARSGVLYVEGTGRAEVHFNSGRIVAAHGNRVQRLGELLVRHGLIEPQTLLSAIERQRQESPDMVLGEVLLSMGAVTQEELARVVQVHIQETIQDVLRWRRGTFRFEMGEVKPIRGFERSLGQLLPSMNLNTQRILLEAARLMDEAGRESVEEEAAPSAPEHATAEPDAAIRAQEPAPIPTSLRNHAVDDLFHTDGRGDDLRATQAKLENGLADAAKRVYIVSSDDIFVGLLAARLDRESIWLERTDADSPEGMEANGSRPLILIDAAAGTCEAAIERLLERAPEATPIAIVDPATPEEYVSTLGAFSIVDREIDAVVARCVELVGGIRELPASAEPSQGLLQRLRRLSAEIRTGALAANATLALLNTLAECSERTVLFAVKDDVLRAIGGFGFSTLNGRPIVEVIRGLTLPITGGNALADAVTRPEALELRFETDSVPEEFLRLVGAPESGQAAVFPVSGTEKVILLVYTDNGCREVEELDLMALAADQVGVAIENEFLRYRLAQS